VVVSALTFRITFIITDPCIKDKMSNGVCDPENDWWKCDYDGGDCLELCEQEGWIGDNECDDLNNFESCGYDGGDCCGQSVDTTYCSKCDCLDPG
jgi:hypothetical protein